MASVTNKEIQEDFNLFGEIFNMYKKFYLPEDNETYWNEVIENSRDISSRFDSALARDLCLIVVDEFERKWRQSNGINSYIDIPNELQAKE